MVGTRVLPIRVGGSWSWTQFRNLAGVAVLAGIGAAALIAPRLKPYLQGPPAARAMWAETYETLGQMRAGADAIVVATVQGTRPGRTVQTPDGSLPFTLVDLVVEQSIRGETPSMITVEQTGGDANGETFLVDGDGGPYQTSQRVVLFLKQQPDTGYYYLVNPQGRFRIGADGRLNAAAPDDPVSQRLDTRTLQQADALIRSPE